MNRPRSPQLARRQKYPSSAAASATTPIVPVITARTISLQGPSKSSAGEYTKKNGTMKPAAANFTACQPAPHTLQRLIDAAAYTARHSGGVTDERQPK